MAPKDIKQFYILSKLIFNKIKEFIIWINLDLNYVGLYFTWNKLYKGIEKFICPVLRLIFGLILKSRLPLNEIKSFLFKDSRSYLF